MEISKFLPENPVTTIFVAGTVLTLGILIARNYRQIEIKGPNFEAKLGKETPHEPSATIEDIGNLNETYEKEQTKEKHQSERKFLMKAGTSAKKIANIEKVNKEKCEGNVYENKDEFDFTK